MSQLTLPSLNQINCKILSSWITSGNEKVRTWPLRMICSLVSPASEVGDGQSLEADGITAIRSLGRNRFFSCCRTGLRGAECQKQGEGEFWVHPPAWSGSSEVCILVAALGRIMMVPGPQDILSTSSCYFLGFLECWGISPCHLSGWNHKVHERSMNT